MDKVWDFSDQRQVKKKTTIQYYAEVSFQEFLIYNNLDDGTEIIWGQN